NGEVYTFAPGGAPALLKAEPVGARQAVYYLPTSDWRLNSNSLSHLAAQFVSPDGTAVLPAGQDFLEAGMSWGIKSSPQLRSFGLAPAEPGQIFYVTDESALTTWAATVNNDGSLQNFRVFAENGGESVVADARGNVFLAAGQIYVYDSGGKQLGVIEVPERPTQLVFGGTDGRTLFITARSSLYSVRTWYPGSCLSKGS